MSRFFVEPENIGTNLIIMNNPDDLHHMMKVLRLKEGDEVDISDGVRWEYRACIESLNREEAELKILDKQAFASEPSVEVTLFQGIPKQGKMETIIQKCVELGVYEIVPVFMDRTVVVDRGNFGKKIQRWNRVSAEAVKQCRRGIVPQVAEPVKTEELLRDRTGSGTPDLFGDFDLVLFPYENEKGTTIKEVLRAATAADSRPKRIAVMIGPEGGFSDEEANAIVAAGGKSVSLGKTILRTETAGMTALAMIMYELEM
ncbi:MAG: 16S rRNA (uracil(1498)-N(3))-methyltransferase [Clostridiales bacterium]|nr:16S rRNA (uracil(1498)-N(3))-methyltransferase [Clostridiales bacterium]